MPIDLGLVVELQLVLGECPAQPPLDLQARLERLLHAGMEEAETVATLVLGTVHGHVRLLEQIAGSAFIQGKQHDTHARRNVQGMAFDEKGFPEQLAQIAGTTVGAGQGLVGVFRDLGEQDDELVSAQARHRILVPQSSGEPGGHLFQQFVAHGVSKRVVDVLEVVEIEKQDGPQVVVPAGARDLPVELVV